MTLFFPDISHLLDYTQTRFLMQELLVDVVGQQTRELDLVVETRYKECDAFILVHIEPQSYRDSEFLQRMFIYFSRLFERHRKEHKLIIPIAIFTFGGAREEPDTLSMSLPEHDILHFQFLKIELVSKNWRQFINSNNPVAAALLAKMGYTQEERREVRSSFLRMIFRLRKNLDEARLHLIWSIGELYFDPLPEEDHEIIAELMKEYPEEAKEMQELMPAWKRWGYEEGIEEGIEKGMQQGMQQGMQHVVRKMYEEGFTTEIIEKVTGLSANEISKILQQQ